MARTTTGAGRGSVAATLALVVLALAALAAPAQADARSAPREFFGISPQTWMSDDDVDHMRAGGIGSVRWPLVWEQVQPRAGAEFDWSGFDQVVRAAARGRMRVLPFFWGTPKWLSRKATVLPIDSVVRRRAWTSFVRAAVARYKPGGEFWRQHRPGGPDPVPRVPVREWQVWNEANFFYFATPASPGRYARLLKLSHGAIKAEHPGAKVILTGLFAEPTAKPPNALPAVTFLRRLYRQPGIRSFFDGVALHPYADRAANLRRMTEEVRRVMLDNRDAGGRLYITEMGWGSQNNPHIVSFERGIRGQVLELTQAYRYLVANRGRLNLRGTYWFTWKDLPDVCNFCDSVGFFHHGDGLRPKPAWHAFVRLTGGRPRP